MVDHLPSFMTEALDRSLVLKEITSGKTVNQGHSAQSPALNTPYIIQGGTADHLLGHSRQLEGHEDLIKAGVCSGSL